MAYKDPERQREAVRLAVRRHRQNKKGITGITPISDNVIPCHTSDVIPKRKPVEPQSHNSMMVGYVPKQE